jgi:hypothetical protein
MPFISDVEPKPVWDPEARALERELARVAPLDARCAVANCEWSTTGPSDVVIASQVAHRLAAHGLHPSSTESSRDRVALARITTTVFPTVRAHLVANGQATRARLTESTGATVQELTRLIAAGKLLQRRAGRTTVIELPPDGRRRGSGSRYVLTGAV